MPIYEFECKEGHVSERFLKIEDTLRFISCDTCQKGAQRIISRPTIHPDIEEYMDENLVPEGSVEGAQLVKSRKHKAELMKQQGLREVEPSYEAKARRHRNTMTFDGGKERTTSHEPSG